ncbi:MAG: hypothetical protein LBU79_08430 [Planctomycetota bacterium]|nr:hypothetical protein [Planctomycetota bacterium]
MTACSSGPLTNSPAASAMLLEAGVAFLETLVTGNAIPDLPLLRRAGLGVAVASSGLES